MAVFSWLKSVFSDDDKKTPTQKDNNITTFPETTSKPVATSTADVANHTIHVTTPTTDEHITATANVTSVDAITPTTVENLDTVATKLTSNISTTATPVITTNTVTEIKTEITTATPIVIEGTEAVIEKPKEHFFKRLVKGLSKTGSYMGANLSILFKGKKIDANLYEEIETSLLTADVGWDTTDKIIKNLQQHVKATELKDPEALFTALKQDLAEIIKPYAQPLDISGHKPYVILMVGVNGVGKTTTIGKITKKLQANGKSVMLAAGDTFRAAAVEQLQEWGNRNNVPVVAQKPGADSASVIYDAFQSAKARNIDVLIADTAGRLQNKAHLIDELRKIVRVIKKIDETAPHEVMITLDATTGQNAINQVEEFDKAVNITGITITKLDGTGKGGVIFAICDKLQKPIRFIGVGEKIDDLQPFDHEQFIKALFETK